MVTTIEPGIYIAPDNKRVPKKWRGIGVRIEGDVLETKKGNRVLTTGIPKTVAEIETFMAQAKQKRAVLRAAWSCHKVTGHGDNKLHP